MRTFSCGAAALIGLLALRASAADVLVEAESLSTPGGWVLDTQFMATVGSPYLMAHGLGQPVADAVGVVRMEKAGKRHVWVRTKDWVGEWKAPGQPGKFQLLVNGQALETIFGTQGADWQWHYGGTVELSAGENKLGLRDLTGFNGRCDAVAFTDQKTAPPNDASLAGWRRKALGLPNTPEDGGSYDLVVVGGGYGGMGAAISAARMGCKVALIQDRAVLGGNGSSEVRVWAMGGVRRGLFPNVGEIVEEFSDSAKLSPGTFEEFGDDKKEALVRAEKNISLFFNNHVLEAEKKTDDTIASVTALDTRTSQRRKFRGRLFCDATGHGSLGALANAELTLREKEHLGMSNMWRWKNESTPQKWPETPWALQMDMEDFPYPQRFHGQWFWESGFDKHPILGLESTRDWNLRAVFGAFSAMKTKAADQHANARLEWVAYIGGTRESRQIMGDVLLTREDIAGKKAFPDGTVPTTWDIDLHYPKEQFAKKFPEDPFISKAVFDKSVDRKHGYPVPYRCFYSKNISNLFTAGRCVSVTHEALGTVRVMKTGGMIGEVVGKAASICIKNDCTPRQVYERYWPEMTELLKLRGAARRETVSAPITLPANYQPPAPPKDSGEEGQAGLDPAKLPGLVLDDTKAQLSGKWTRGFGLPGYYANGYLYRVGHESGGASYNFVIPAAGKYEVRLSYQPHENRATDTPVLIESADTTKIVAVNQRIAPPLPGGFVSLGTFSFSPGQSAVVTIGAGAAKGSIHADLVQLLPVTK